MNETADELCKDFCIASVQDVKVFVDNVIISWVDGYVSDTRQEFIATAKAYKYACKWCIGYYNKQSFLDSLTADDWYLAFSNVSEDKACGFYPYDDFIVIRNGNKVFAKENFSEYWFNNVKSKINGVCDVVINSYDVNKINMISELEIRHLSCYKACESMTLTL